MHQSHTTNTEVGGYFVIISGDEYTKLWGIRWRQMGVVYIGRPRNLLGMTQHMKTHGEVVAVSYQFDRVVIIYNMLPVVDF